MSKLQKINGSRKPNRKNLEKHIHKCHDEIQRLKKFIDDECTQRGDVLRMYAAWRVSVQEICGESKLQKVIRNIEDMTAADAYEYKHEAHAIFGDNMENPRQKRTNPRHVKKKPWWRFWG